MATLEVRSLSAPADGDVPTLAEVSFAIPHGHVTALVGAAGSGKTALLRLLAGLDRPASGDVLLDDISVLQQPVHRRGIGMMFEDLALFPHMNARDNIAFGLRMLGWPAADRERRIDDLLELVGLNDRGDTRVDVLGADEQRQVALARTLASQPSVLLLDEPLGAIDEARKAAARVALGAILDTLETTTLIATRDVRDATALADELIVIAGGRVLQVGATGMVLGQPATVEVAELAGYVTLAEGPLREGRVDEAGVGTVAVPADTRPGDLVRVLAHPASLLAVPTDTGLGCGVIGLMVRARAQGPMWVLDIALGSRQIEARWEWDLVPPRPGARLAIAVRPGTLRVFSATLRAGEAPPVTPTPRTAEPPALREHERHHRGMPLA